MDRIYTNRTCYYSQDLASDIDGYDVNAAEGNKFETEAGRTFNQKLGACKF